MTNQEIKQYFQYHNENIKLLRIGFEHIRSQLKFLYHNIDNHGNFIYLLDANNPEKISTRKIEKSLSRILSGIQVSWAEESIKRLLYEENLFTDVQRAYLIEQPALDQRWYTTLKIVFSIAYDLVPISDETCETVRIEKERKNLGDELVDHYLELRDIITDHLVPNFRIRNKVQHGEWEYAFKPSYSAVFSEDITIQLNRENIVSTTSRFTLVNTIYQMIVDLGRFKSNRFALDSMQTPFEYFYNRSIVKINYEVKKICIPDLETYISEMLEKEKRGEQRRKLIPVPKKSL